MVLMTVNGLMCLCGEAPTDKHDKLVTQQS